MRARIVRFARGWLARILVSARMGMPGPVELETDVAASFREHVRKWQAERRASPSSSSQRMFASPHYHAIMGMGQPVVPLLLAELEARPDHWDRALEAITGENPVPPEAAGKIKAIAQAWVDWGRARRFV